MDEQTQSKFSMQKRAFADQVGELFDPAKRPKLREDHTDQFSLSDAYEECWAHIRSLEATIKKSSDPGISPEQRSIDITVANVTGIMVMSKALMGIWNSLCVHEIEDPEKKTKDFVKTRAGVADMMFDMLHGFLNDENKWVAGAQDRSDLLLTVMSLIYQMIHAMGVSEEAFAQGDFILKAEEEDKPKRRRGVGAGQFGKGT